MYDWSVFLLRVSSLDGRVLLYSTLTGAVVVFGLKEYKEINKVIAQKKISKDFELPVKQLLKNGLLVKSCKDEKKNFLSLLDEELINNKHFTLHILPTTGCNFNCPYCYQSGIDRVSALTKGREEKVKRYIKNFIKNKNLSEATVVIHGGEPTIFWSPIITLLPFLQNLFKKNKISFRTQIVSNGYNLTREKIDFLSKFNWQRFQVTIDGPKDTHDSRRCLKNGGKTFDTILNNIRYALENKKIEKVSIRINFDEANFASIKQLLRFLSRKFDTDRIILSLGFISKTVDDTDANDYIREYGIKLENLKEKYLELYKEAISSGFEMPDLFMFDGMCTAKLDNSLVISSDGNIFKCLSGVGRKEFCVGNIEELDKELPNYLFKELYNECLDKDCEFLPLCNTGCRFNAFLKNGTMNSIDCRREVLLDINEAF